MSQPLESPGLRRGVGPCRTLIITAALLLTAGMALRVSSSVAEGARAPSAPGLAEPATQQVTSEVAIVASGCFWGVQSVFQHVEGVTSAISGYAGGTKDAAQYERVSTGTTGHAEAVRITFDPHRISYGRILQIYFSVAHDSTEVDRQGPDVGTQYRSAIFPANQEQARIAGAYIAQLSQARMFPAGIATRIEPGRISIQPRRIIRII
jgi:peptide-methionine (S)-S-oxide reductase